MDRIFSRNDFLTGEFEMQLCSTFCARRRGFSSSIAFSNTQVGSGAAESSCTRRRVF